MLAAGAREGNGGRALVGEVWVLDGSRSVFGPEPWSDALGEREDGERALPPRPRTDLGEGGHGVEERALKLVELVEHGRRESMLRRNKCKPETS